MSLTNKEALDKITNNLINFLSKFTFLDSRVTSNYKQLSSLAFHEKVHFINHYLKPSEIDLDGLIETELKKYGHSKSQFSTEEFTTFRRYLMAMIALV